MFKTGDRIRHKMYEDNGKMEGTVLRLLEGCAELDAHGECPCEEFDIDCKAPDNRWYAIDWDYPPAKHQRCPSDGTENELTWDGVGEPFIGREHEDVLEMISGR